MIRSVLAVVAGFLVIALLVTVSTALAVRFVLNKPLASLRSPSSEPLSRAYLAANLGASALAALAAAMQLPRSRVTRRSPMDWSWRR
jgi:hypothetical protein